jgi:hypothetical protein
MMDCFAVLHSFDSLSTLSYLFMISFCLRNMKSFSNDLLLVFMVSLRIVI